MKILVIGGGNMGLIYAKGFISSHIVNKSGIMILERSKEKKHELINAGFENIFLKPGEYIHQADLIILAVKPQNSSQLFKDISGYVGSDQVILSIMAGITMDTIKNALNVSKIIRAMPNLASQIGQSMTAFTSTDDVSRIELLTVQNLINTTGKSIYIEDEKMIDAATAISGSGPAYVLYFLDSIIKTAIKMGFSPSEAELLVTQTFSGTINLYNRNNHSPAQWIEMVASKGGTTEAALKSFDSSHLSKIIRTGIETALQRAIELGQKE